MGAVMFYIERGLREIIQLIILATTVLLGNGQAFAVDGPSFDCHGVRQTLVVILCTDPEAAQADWDVVGRTGRSLTMAGKKPNLPRWSINAVPFLV
jgi:hypothetical protein